MGHDHTHPVIVAFITGIVLFLVLNGIDIPDPIKHSLVVLLFLVLLMLIYQRYLELP